MGSPTFYTSPGSVLKTGMRDEMVATGDYYQRLLSIRHDLVLRERPEPPEA